MLHVKMMMKMIIMVWMSVTAFLSM